VSFVIRSTCAAGARPNAERNPLIAPFIRADYPMPAPETAPTTYNLSRG
jgi:hypothetical protein